MTLSTGGDYVHLREAYGRPWAFMSGWLVTGIGIIRLIVHSSTRGRPAMAVKVERHRP